MVFRKIRRTSRGSFDSFNETLRSCWFLAAPDDELSRKFAKEIDVMWLREDASLEAFIRTLAKHLYAFRLRIEPAAVLNWGLVIEWIDNTKHVRRPEVNRWCRSFGWNRTKLLRAAFRIEWN
ncbi:MAG: hypothetical protein ACTS43_02000 [Candidatus Hodgkinia cicadicola]